MKINIEVLVDDSVIVLKALRGILGRGYECAVADVNIKAIRKADNIQEIIAPEVPIQAMTATTKNCKREARYGNFMFRL
jgi:hypothetical protein